MNAKGRYGCAKPFGSNDCILPISIGKQRNKLFPSKSGSKIVTTQAAVRASATEQRIASPI
jgi:hypothetical protein